MNIGDKVMDKRHPELTGTILSITFLNTVEYAKILWWDSKEQKFWTERLWPTYNIALLHDPNDIIKDML